VTLSTFVLGVIYHACSSTLLYQSAEIFDTRKLKCLCYRSSWNRSFVSLRSTCSNCRVLFCYLHSFVHVLASLHLAQLSHSEHAMPRGVIFFILTSTTS